MMWSLLKSLFQVCWGLIKGFKWLLIPCGVLVVLFLIDLLYQYFRYFRKNEREVIGHINYTPNPNLFEQIFILLPKQIWRNYYNKPKGSFSEHGIIIFCGAQGQGKTIAETKYLNDMRVKYPSLKIYTNYGYNYEDTAITGWRELVYKNNGQNGVICAIDELQNWFSSNLSKNFPPRMMATVTQNRKNRRVIIGSSHFFNNIAKPIRIHTTEIRDCRTLFGCFTIVKRTKPIFDSSGEVIKRKFLGIYSFVHSKELYESYDTYKVIENLSEAGFKDDDYAVLDVGGNAYTTRPKKRKRSAYAEQTVNQNIDSVMNSF